MAEITYETLCERFDEMFDDCHPEIKFGCLTYQPSDVLKRVDPIAYREEVINFIDSLLTDEEIYEHADGSYHDEPEDKDDGDELVYVVTSLQNWDASPCATLIADLLEKHGEAEVTTDSYGAVISVQRVTKD